jgi:hypothetical protein
MGQQRRADAAFQVLPRDNIRALPLLGCICQRSQIVRRRWH